jgi:hypothetical protein
VCVRLDTRPDRDGLPADTDHRGLDGVGVADGVQCFAIGSPQRGPHSL